MNLGQITAQYIKLLESQAQVWEDPILCGNSTDCERLIAQAQLRELDRFAKANGFMSSWELNACIQARTSYRWVHFNLR